MHWFNVSCPELRGGGGGGRVLPEKFAGGVRPASQNLTLLKCPD